MSLQKLQLTLVSIALSCGPIFGEDNNLESSLRTLSQTLAQDLQARGVKKLAALDFVDLRGYRSALDGFLAEELVTQVMVTSPGKFTFVERRQLGRILDEQKLTSSAFFDEKTLANVGKILGLDAVLTGSVSDLGTQIRINARAVAVETGEVFSSASISILKEGPVAELLRQTAGPEQVDVRDTATQGAPFRRDVQASDVFFENRLVRVTVASTGMATDKRNVSLSLVVENLSNADLLLALPTTDGSGGCAMTISDAKGNLMRVQRSDLGGLPCLYSFEEKTTGSYAAFAPRSKSTIAAKVFSQQPVGNVLSVALEFLTLVGDRVNRFSAGLSNIEVH